MSFSSFYNLSLSLVSQSNWEVLFGRELIKKSFEPRHDKTNKISVRSAKTQISLGIRPVRSESSLSAWRNLGSLATQWALSEDFDQTGRMPRLIWVFARRTVILLVLSCRGSFLWKDLEMKMKSFNNPVIININGSSYSIGESITIRTKKYAKGQII